jgi:hypothetical protein
MVEPLGIITKRPFCWVLTFVVDGEAYSVGSVFYDSTNTRKKELYGKYYLALFKVKKLLFKNDKTTKKELLDVVLEEEPVKNVLVDFYKTFSADALEEQKDGWLTSKAKKQYDLEENTIISNRLFSDTFPDKYKKELFTMLFEVV